LDVFKIIDFNMITYNFLVFDFRRDFYT
jgi:hypothetical protein